MYILRKNKLLIILFLIVMSLSACGKKKREKVKAYNEQGLINFKNGQYQEAVYQYDEAILLNPEHGESYNNRGHALTANQQYALALMDYEKAIELKSDNFETYAYRGVCYYAQDKVDQAFDDYNKAIQLNPKDGKAYRYRGFVYVYDKKENFKGCSDWRKACELDVNLCDAYQNGKQSGLCVL